MKESYDNYEDSLEKVNLETLKIRRESLCLNFAKSCTKNPLVQSMFPLNQDNVGIHKKKEKYKVQFASKKRLQQSSIPYMQNLLNKLEEVSCSRVMCS